MGFSSIPGSTQTAAQLRDSLQTLSGASRLDASAIKSLPSGGLAAWQTKTSNYTAVAGDRIRAQLSSADLTITLPLAPSTGDEIEIQRLDVTANSLIIDPNGKPFKSVASKDGLLNNGNIGLSERISFVDNIIGWLPQNDQLTYQTHVGAGGGDPLFASVRLLLHLDTDLSDSSSSAFTVTNTATTISTASKQWGAGSCRFNGSALLTLPTNAALNRGTGDFCWEFWINPDTGSSTVQRNLFKAPGGSAGGLSISNTGRLTWDKDGVGNLITGTPPVVTENTWHYLALSRSGSTITVWLDNASYSSFTDNAAYNFSGWFIGHNAYNSKFIGYMDDIRYTIVNRTITAIPSAAFPDS